jgi:carotenoid 1,2-hydratase
MTERGRSRLERSPSALVIGPSALSWKDGCLSFEIDEITVPWPSRIKGRVEVYPSALTNVSVALDGAGKHRWHPMAPCAGIEVRLEKPFRHWHGHAYFDSNVGDEPLEKCFSGWEWSRMPVGDRTAVFYDTTRIGGERLTVGKLFAPNGTSEDIEIPQNVKLPPTLWRIPRSTFSERPALTGVRRTLEDGPFYARSLIDSYVLGESSTAIHESLSLARFRQLGVQAMLPFRMPRRSA